MSRYARRLFLAACLGLAFGPRANAEKPQSQAAKVEQLIAQLGSRKFPEREAASTALEAMGELALDALRRAAKSGEDAETRRRAKRLVCLIEHRVDYEKLQGTWVVVAAERDGKSMPVEKFEEKRLVFAGHKITIRVTDGAYKGSFELDAGKAPKTIDYHSPGLRTTRGTFPLDSWQDAKGIYRFHGDKLTICRVRDYDASILPKNRPTDFTTASGVPRELLTLKRQKC